MEKTTLVYLLKHSSLNLQQHEPRMQQADANQKW
jgi:hypothetical protein